MTELTGSVNADARAWTGGRLTVFVARIGTPFCVTIDFQEDCQPV